MGVDLSVDFGKFKLKNPVIGASGTCGYSIEYNVYFDIKKLGAIATKGITLQPKAGNEGERVFEVENGIINRIGLENIGIQRFISQKKPVLEKYDLNYILNIAGDTFEEYFELADICAQEKIPAVELNVSCPNVKSGCLEFGVEPKSLEELVKGVRKRYDGFLIVKLTPNTFDIESLAYAVENAGADCISAINTVKGLGIDIKFLNGKFYKTFLQGGLSGKCIKPVALSMVKRIKKASKLPVIGLGGISSLSDLFEFIAAGADAFQVGTANFTTPNICEKLVDELTNFMEKNNFKTFEELKKEIRR